MLNAPSVLMNVNVRHTGSVHGLLLLSFYYYPIITEYDHDYDYDYYDDDDNYYYYYHYSRTATTAIGHSHRPLGAICTGEA